MKKIEQKQDNTNLIPVSHGNTSLPGDSKLKSELTLLQRKYNRLEQKEKRVQVDLSFECLSLVENHLLAIMSRMGKQS